MDFVIGNFTIVFNDPFENTLLMILLIVLTLLSYALMVYFRGKRATYFANIKTLERIHGFKRFYVSPFILIFKIVIIAMLFLVATGTLEILEQKAVINTDYVILMDVSSSMAQTDYPPDRLTAAKEISSSWLNVLPENTKVGLVTFSQDIEDSVSLSLDRTLLSQRIDDIAINYQKSGTNLDFALNYGYSLFDNGTSNKTVLLLTDDAEDINIDTITTANANDITIFAFGIGSSESEAYEFDPSIPLEFQESFNRFEFNITKLELITNATDGVAYRVSNVTGLRQAFRDATLETVNIQLNSSYYIILIIALMSIIEFLLYAKVGGL